MAINKPHGLLVHKTRLATDAQEFALQLLRNQVGYRVYPAHRLDRKTSGVLLFSKSPETNRIMQQLFRERKVEKIYRAIVRGFCPEHGTIDYPLVTNDKSQDARTDYKLLEKFEIDVPSDKFDTSRYSLIELHPLTGRHHQLRKHMAHIFHPIIGDRPHGCNKQNRIWKERFNMTTMLLHAQSLAFENQGTNEIRITTDPSTEFERVLRILRNQKVGEK